MPARELVKPALSPSSAGSCSYPEHCVLRDEVPRRSVVPLQRDAVASEVDQKPVVGLDSLGKIPRIGPSALPARRSQSPRELSSRNPSPAPGQSAGVIDRRPQLRNALAVVVDPNHDSVALADPILANFLRN